VLQTLVVGLWAFITVLMKRRMNDRQILRKGSSTVTIQLRDLRDREDKNQGKRSVKVGNFCHDQRHISNGKSNKWYGEIGGSTRETVKRVARILLAIIEYYGHDTKRKRAEES